MGKYLNFLNERHMGTSFDEKCNSLINFGALEIPTPKNFIPDVLVCVVDNGYMAAAAYCNSEDEFKRMSNESERPTRWFYLKDAGNHAK